jgi:hypothetical protein
MLQPQLQLTGPTIRDLRATLPRIGEYQRRSLDIVAGVLIHHTAGAHLDWTAEDIAKYHITPRPEAPEGWPGIGYPFLVHWDGAIDWCQDLEAVTYHGDGQPRINGVGIYNWQMIGICLTGDFVQGRTPTPRQLLATHELTSLLSWALGRRLPVVGHQEISATLCPGDTWAEWGKVLRC